MGSRRVLTRQRAVIADHSAAVHESSFAPYAAPSEHLSDMLLRFDWLIKRQIARGHARKPASIVDFAAIREQRANRETLEQVLLLASSSRGSGTPLIYLHRVRHSDGDRLVRRAAARLNVPIIAVDTELLPDAPGDFESSLFRLFREALLSQGGIYLRNIDRALEHPSGASRYRALLRCAAEMGSVVFASGNEAWRWPLPQEPVTLRIVELHADGIIDQMNAWQAVSNNELGDTERHRLVSLYPMSVATIRDVWRMAQATTHGDRTMPTFDQVEQACRKFASPPVGALAP